MLTFKAIGDGNCLYNAEAISLIQAFRQKELDPLFKNKQRLTQFHELLKIFQANGLIKVDNKITQKAVKDGFTQLVNKFTVDGKINWDELQSDMAIGLREFVQNAIMTDEETNQNVRKDLVRALDFSINMACENSIKTNTPLPDKFEINAIDAAYFEEMPAIKAKIVEILENKTLKTPELKKIALSEWFFEGGAVGFSDYLQGENGIGNPAIHAADIEVKVLSSKLGIVHRSYMRGQVGNEQSATYYNGFLSDEKSREVDKNTVLFSFEKAAIHWDALFIDTPANQALIKERAAQITNNELQVYLEIHGSYKAHCGSLEMEEADYCALYGLTKEQFDNPPAVKAHKEAKKPAVDTNKPLDVKTADTAKKDDTVKDDKPASTTVANTNANRNFAINWLASSVVLATIFHCVLMPLLKGVLVSSALVAPSALLMLAITLAVSCAGGFLVANKMGSTTTDSKAKAVISVEENIVSSKIKTARVEKPQIDLLEKTPTFLVFQNTRAQTAKRAKIAALEGRPSGPRQKLN